MLQPIANPFGDLFDFLGLLERPDGEDVAVVLLQVQFEFIGQFGKFASVLKRFLVFGFEDFVALEPSVGKAYVVRRLRRELA